MFIMRPIKQTNYPTANKLSLNIYQHRGLTMSMSIATLGFTTLFLMLLGVLPIWSHSRQWGYVPTQVVGFALVILLALAFLGVI